MLVPVLVTALTWVVEHDPWLMLYQTILRIICFALSALISTCCVERHMLELSLRQIHKSIQLGAEDVAVFAQRFD